MNILLINPPLTRPTDITTRVGICPPLGLAYIAAMLQQAGHRVHILDALAESLQLWLPYTGRSCLMPGHLSRFGKNDVAILNAISSYAPDVVGVTCPFANLEWDALNVCALAKQVGPHIRTIIGGAHPSCCPERFMGDPNVDFVVQGEGESVMLDIANGMAPPEPLLRRAPVFDIDTIPMPARHLLSMPTYLSSASPHSGYKLKPYTNIITSRGCPNRCRFCVIRQIWGRRCRYRSPDSVIAEVEHLVDTYNIKELHIEDDNFLAQVPRAKEILKRLELFDLSLSSPSGLAVHTLDEPMLVAMQKAGYYSVSLAVESGVRETLRLMNKPVDLDRAEKVVRTAHDLGLRVKAFFILGYPGESRDDIQRTIDYAESLMHVGLDWALFFPATAIRGSKMESGCRDRNWLVPTPPERFFTRPNIQTNQFGPDDVVQWVEEANERVNSLSRWRRQLKGVVTNYPHLTWAKEALDGLTTQNISG